MKRILPQRVDGVEIIVRCDDGAESIGQKRNILLSQCTGDWVCFVDDDDLVREDYVSLIVRALDLNPDCVGFWVRRFVDGKFDGRACHSLRYSRYATNFDGPNVLYERTPNHLNPVRRFIALQAGFPEQNHGEDTSYASRIYPLLESEVFIDLPMYDYLYVTMGTRQERTNELIRNHNLTPEQWFQQAQGAA